MKDEEKEADFKKRVKDLNAELLGLTTKYKLGLAVKPKISSKGTIECELIWVNEAEKPAEPVEPKAEDAKIVAPE